MNLDVLLNSYKNDPRIFTIADRIGMPAPIISEPQPQKIHLSGKTQALAYKVLGDNETLALVLLVHWGNRLHYLLGMSNSEGLKQEAMPFFFKNLMSTQKGSGQIIDFEGSSLPGVAAFFRSIGAEEEGYGLWSK